MDLEQDITNGHPSRKGEGIKSHNAEALTNKKRVHDRKQKNNDKKNSHETDGHKYTVENRALNSALFQKPVNTLLMQIFKCVIRFTLNKIEALFILV